MTDHRQLVITGTDGLAPFARSERLIAAMERALERVRKPGRENTQRAYQAAWSRWGKHCDALGLELFPVNPVELIGYLEQLSETHAPNSVRVALSAIAMLDQQARMTPTDLNPFSVRRHLVVQKWLKSWRDTHPAAPLRKAPHVTAAELERVIVRAQEPGRCQSRPAHVARYTRDRAMLLMGVCGGLRVSELAGLDLGDVVSHPRGMVVHVRRSKADKHGKGRIVPIAPQARLVRCAVDAWGSWLKLRGTEAGPAWFEVHRSGTIGTTKLSAGAAARMVRTRASAAELVLVSSHSMRASLATLAKEQGHDPLDIAKHGGWKSLDTLGGYMRQADLFDEHNPTWGLLDD